MYPDNIKTNLSYKIKNMGQLSLGELYLGNISGDDFSKI